MQRVQCCVFSPLIVALLLIDVAHVQLRMCVVVSGCGLAVGLKMARFEVLLVKLIGQVQWT